MCGIAGVISWDGRYCISRDALEAMRRCIAHRGPDAHTVTLNHEGEPSQARPQVGLVHHRLAVIDLDPRANQPMSDGRGRTIVFNGEIYNYRELRKELTGLVSDHAWRSESDTEVLLVAYRAWDEKCVDHLNGMFAFAIWDESARTVFCARDRMGQKPLYFTLLGGRESNCCGIGFASELGALRHVSGFDGAMDERALSMYLRWGYVPAPLTIYQQAEKLPPGCWLKISPDGAALERYFDPNEPRPAPELFAGRSQEEVVARTRELLTQAVRRQLVADVPVGCFLSGGIDSSIVAAAMNRAVGRGQEVHTFSIGFADKRYDETRYAAEVAQHLGTTHRQFIVEPDAAKDLPLLAATFGEPFADSSALPTHYLSRETRKHVTVALSGDGGDELFAGYDRYRAMWLGEAFLRMPGLGKKIAVSKLWQRLPGQHPKMWTTRLKRMLKTLELTAAQRYDSFMRIESDDTIEALLGKRRDAKLDAEAASWLASEFARLNKERDVVEAAMALDRVTYLPHDLLFKVDASSMLHALEVRSPFMDHELVHFAASLSSRELLGAEPSASDFMNMRMTMPGKRLLKLAFGRDLPETVFQRKKMGFAVPIGDWLRTSLREMVNDFLKAKDSFARQRLNPDAIDQLLLAHETRHGEQGAQLYSLLMLELWHHSAR